MRFYNPFKAHIVRFENDIYAVRKLHLLVGWEYKERTTEKYARYIQWWSNWPSALCYCTVKSLEEAKMLLKKQHYNPRKPLKAQVIYG